MPPPGSVSSRNLGLDLIRALAITLVLISHCGNIFADFYGARSPDYVAISGLFGVELFFVLSGFLIGTLLLRIVRARPTRREWLVFMMRRWMRTLPLYFLWMGVLLVLLPPRAHTLNHVLHYATLTQNLFWPMPPGKWFGVSWSLSVEEWFYLLFSAALLGAVALTGGRRCAWWAIALFIVVPVAERLVLPQSGDWWQTTYETVGLRLDAVAYGVALAKLAEQRSALFRHPWLALSVGAPIVAFVWLQASRLIALLPNRLFMAVMLTLTSTGFALCFPAALRLVDGRNWLARFVRQLSAQSYGLYIMHLSILELVGYRVHQGRLSAAMGILLVIVFSFGLSYASFRWFETPILARRPRQEAAREARAPAEFAEPVREPAEA